MDKSQLEQRLDDIDDRLVDDAITDCGFVDHPLLRVMDGKRLVVPVAITAGGKLVPQRKKIVLDAAFEYHDVRPCPLAFTEPFPGAEQIFHPDNLQKAITLWIGMQMSSPPRKFADIPLVHTLYTAYAAWHELVLKFPKSQRYSLGEQCSKQLLCVLETIFVAAALLNGAEKTTRLREASGKIDTLKLLVRLAKDCKCISNSQYLDMESRLHEAGKMLGGWIKSMG